MREEKILEMKDISIGFSGIQVLKSIDFTVRTGEIQALVGANGAGKSTLMKILSGAYSNYTGHIFLDGKKITIDSPKASKKHGIQIVYQEVDAALIQHLTVAENIILDELVNEGKSKLFVNWKNTYSRAAEILKTLHINIDVRKIVYDLSLAEKQMVLIARALSHKCSFLILDEPTAPLSNRETEKLFEVIKDLKNTGVGTIFISHRMPEIFRISDVITILRDGELAAKEKISDVDEDKIVNYMLGRSLNENVSFKHSSSKEEILSIEALRDGDKVKGADIKLHKGEIVGIAGLVGAGKTELCSAIFGAAATVTGQVKLMGKKVQIKNPSDAVRLGFAFVPEERRKEGMLIEESVTFNLTMASIENITSFGFLLNLVKSVNEAEGIRDSLKIKTPNVNTKIKNLSGGNQQKVVIGKWLIVDADIYIFDEPTKGVDVGAKQDIFKLIDELAAAGKSVLYATCEFSELLAITDRIYVIYDGRTVKEIKTSGTSEKELLHYSMGGK
ncbi:sugar ABC transporter ATP-binding protein [Clostridium oryzae]|uniref:Galactose/methyl galactoside import ATP-binding protein MglA n=1 Tax=Clostridium oryzae TaxID=1450648 RepID=A0A1V4IXN4_9CLOT|nr:sugar ABC transporter ATP-binding protein [Clostridium oryzae]OPJ64669.1 galactose/methyl galactoside import ATP-binding protein MglA [Clostridium oryzae]